jgi:hypothetical protein
MEHFNWNEAHEGQYAAYRSDPEWGRIYSFLRHGYWHVTSPGNWQAIKKSGAIKPNINGRFRTRWSGITDRSYAYIQECVSLFDFITPSEEDVIRLWDRSWPILTDNEATTVLLRIDRRQLRSKIIPNCEAGVKYLQIPHCEVWFPGPIPIDSISSVYHLPQVQIFGEFNPVIVRASRDL